MPRFYETTLSITNLHNLSISTHVNRSRILTSIFKQGKTCWNIRYAYFQMLTTRTCKWIYGCMMPTV